MENTNILDLAILTIGQTPRKDLVNDIQKLRENGFKVEEFGLLDDFNEKEIQDFIPASSDNNVLVTILRNGQQVFLSKEKIVHYLIKKIETLPKNKWTLIFCTGDFSKWTFPPHTLFPDRIILNTIKGLLNNEELGVIVPEENQKKDIIEKWRKGNIKVISESTSPYNFDSSKLLESFVSLRRKGVEMIVLDCMGYTSEMKSILLKKSDKPIIVSRELMFNILKSII